MNETLQAGECEISQQLKCIIQAMVAATGQTCFSLTQLGPLMTTGVLLNLDPPPSVFPGCVGWQSAVYLSCQCT